jgi:4-hydroxybenzoate polyprenyltransferase
MRTLSAYVRLLRPVQWIKNGFVLAGIFFAGKVFDGDILIRALTAFAAFCLASSAVYVLNDLLDREADRNHPRKRQRPLAAATASVPAAVALGLACAAGSLLLSLSLSGRLAALLGLYGLINAVYSRWLKHVVLLDVFCIASGFLLRLLAGTWGIGLPPSQWFVLCTFLLSLFLGFSKRYAERMDESQHAESKRAVVEEYSPEFLRLLLAVTLACTLMAYGLYTMSPRTLAVHGTERLIYTLPFAAFVMFRYLYLVVERGFGENLSGEFWRDKALFGGTLFYLLCTGLLLFGRG